MDKLFEARFDTPFGIDGLSSVTTIDNETQIKLIGNPVSDQLRFDVEMNTASKIQFQITDAIGHLVYQSTPQTIVANKTDFAVDVSQFSEGMYILTVYTERGLKTIRFNKH